MSPTARTIAISILVTSVAVVTVAIIRPAGAVQRPPVVYTAEQHEVVVSIEQMFAEADLDIPAVEIYFWSDRTPCKGNEGLHRRYGDQQPNRIDVCSTFDNPLIPEAQRIAWERILTHELAHAWLDASLDDAARRRFVELRQLETWSDPAEDWAARASEHAAEIIRWGLTGSSQATWRFDNNTCAELAVAYLVLVGRGPLAECETPEATGDVVGASSLATGLSSGRDGSTEPMLAWALDRFRLAGLELPELDIIVHGSTADCGGHVGYYVTSTNQLHVCRLDKKSVLHELAHAWADHNLTDRDRRAFVQLRGLADWNDHGQDWNQRATEHAAETLTWALMDRETTVRWIDGDGTETRRLLRIEESSPDELAAAYRLLTGDDAPFRVSDAEASRPTFSPELHRAAH